MIKFAFSVLIIFILLNFGATYYTQVKPITLFVAPDTMAEGQSEIRFIDVMVTSINWITFLTKVEKADKPVILYGGHGGYMSVGEVATNQLIEMNKIKPITIVVTGLAASAHALLICNVPNTYHTSSAVLMFHAPISHKGVITQDINTPALYHNCVKKGILTESDVLKLTSPLPREVWVYYFNNNTRTVVDLPDRRLKINGGYGEVQ